MTFQWPLLLLMLLLVPLALAGYLLLQRRRMRYAVRFTNLEVLAGVAGGAAAWRRYLPPALFLLALTALLVGFARPRVTMKVPREQATVILVMDVSGSMRAQDVKPTRLAAAQAAARTFLDKLPDKFRVGMVSFATEAQVAAPATDDRKLVLQAIEYLDFGFGTAIGDAIARAVEVARSVPGEEAPPSPAESRDAERRPKGEAAPTAILLLSDGHQTRGYLQPLQGAERAKSFGIPVFTVALGTPDGVIVFGGGGFGPGGGGFGPGSGGGGSGFGRRIPVPPDPVTLRRIAETTGGEFFEVRDADKLNAVYAGLGSRIGRVEEKREVTFAFAAAGALLLLAAGALSRLWGQRLP